MNMGSVWFLNYDYNDSLEDKDPGAILSELEQVHECVYLISNKRQKSGRRKWIGYADAIRLMKGGYTPKALFAYHASSTTFEFIKHAPLKTHIVIKLDSGGYFSSYRSPRHGSGCESLIRWILSPIRNRKKQQLASKSLERANSIIIESYHAYSNFMEVFPYHSPKVRIRRNPMIGTQATTHLQKADQIIAIGRWDDLAQKRFFRMIKAYERYRELSNAPFRLYVVGKLPKRYPVVDGITYCGMIENADLIPIYLQSKILLSSSQWEGFPNVFLEALSNGCSICSTPYPAAKDATFGGSSGTVSYDFSSHALGSALNVEASLWTTKNRSIKQIQKVASLLSQQLTETKTGWI